MYKWMSAVLMNSSAFYLLICLYGFFFFAQRDDLAETWAVPLSPHF